VLFREPTAESLVQAVQRFERTEQAFVPAAIRNHALKFDRERCREALRDYLLGDALTKC